MVKITADNITESDIEDFDGCWKNFLEGTIDDYPRSNKAAVIDLIKAKFDFLKKHMIITGKSLPTDLSVVYKYVLKSPHHKKYPYIYFMGDGSEDAYAPIMFSDIPKFGNKTHQEYRGWTLKGLQKAAIAETDEKKPKTLEQLLRYHVKVVKGWVKNSSDPVEAAENRAKLKRAHKNLNELLDKKAKRIRVTPADKDRWLSWWIYGGWKGITLKED